MALACSGETDGGDTNNGGATSGGSANGGSANGGSANGGSANGGSGTAGASGGSFSGDDQRRLGTLSDAEMRALCDWAANGLGGYGTRTTCPDGSQAPIRPAANQAACMATRPLATCLVTVAEFKACYGAIAADICKGDIALASPVCSGLLA